MRVRRHHQMVHDLLAQGHGIRTIACHLGWGLHTVRRYARVATWQELADGRWQGPRARKLDPFKSHLHQRVNEGSGKVAQLFREIRARGCPGSYSTVRDYLGQHHPATTPLPPAPPTVRDVTGWLTRPPREPDRSRAARLKVLLDRCPELQAASGHVRTFATMLTQLSGQNLPQRISDGRAAELPGISSFANGLEQDLDAVTCGLTSRWNSGRVEGRVNYIKRSKGRCSADPGCRCSASRRAPPYGATSAPARPAGPIRDLAPVVRRLALLRPGRLKPGPLPVEPAGRQSPRMENAMTTNESSHTE